MREYLSIKADLHIHNSFDYMEKHFGIPVLPHPREYIDRAVELGFRVLSFTNHGILFDDSDTFDYARKNNILLVPGEEAFIDKKHVLLYNFPRRHISTFSELRNFLAQDRIVMAPHPFFPGRYCLKKDLLENIDCFDALEHCHFHAPFFNFNIKAEKLSRLYNLPLVGSSDAHTMKQFGKTYSILKVREVTIKGVFEAIRSGRVEVHSTPLSLLELAKYYLYSRRWTHALKKISEEWRTKVQNNKDIEPDQ